MSDVSKYLDFFLFTFLYVMLIYTASYDIQEYIKQKLLRIRIRYECLELV